MNKKTEMEIVLSNWENIKEYVKKEFDMTSISYAAWVKPLEIARIVDNTVYLKKEMEGAEEYIERKYFSYFRLAVLELCGEKCRFAFEENEQES